jgi:hypothetical protein
VRPPPPFGVVYAGGGPGLPLPFGVIRVAVVGTKKRSKFFGREFVEIGLRGCQIFWPPPFPNF